jgi:hypothetical protein
MAVLALGTAQQARVCLQALVVEGVGSLFQLLLCKQTMHALGAYVDQRQQKLHYRSAANQLCSLPLQSYELQAVEQAAVSQLAALLHSGAAEVVCVGAAATGSGLQGSSSSGGGAGGQVAASGSCRTCASRPKGSAEGAAAAGSGLPGSSSSSSCCFDSSSDGAGVEEEEWQDAQESWVEEAAAEPWVAVSLCYTGKQRRPVQVQLLLVQTTGGIAEGLAAAAESMGGAGQQDQPSLASLIGQQLAKTRPHAYFRWCAWLSSLLVLLVGTCLPTATAALSCLLIGLGSHVVLGLGLWLQPWARQAWGWWQELLQPVPVFEEPGPQRVAPRCRKKSRLCWVAGLLRRHSKGQPPTASQQRQYRRLEAATKQHDKAELRHKLAAGSSRASVSIFVLSLLLMISAAAATPAAVSGLQLVTGNLAMWELSHLAGWKFRGGQ